jgi:hypothetical protein
MKKQQESTVVMERQGNRRQGWLRLSCAGLLAWSASTTADVSEPFYQLSVSEDLAEILVEARLPEDGRSLVAPDGEVQQLRDLTGCRGEPVIIRAGRIATEQANGCLRYRYPLLPQSGRRTPPVRKGVRVSTPGAWLWTPTLAAGERLLIEIEGDAAGSVSLPWQPLGANRFELRPSPGSATGTAVFGDFASLAVETTGAIAYTARSARTECDLALAALEPVAPSPYKDALVGLAEFAVNRTH